MSSAKFETALVPVGRARNVLLVLSAACTVTGAVLILCLPLRPLLEAAVLCLWLWRGVSELRSRLRGASRLGRLRMEPSGRVTGVGCGGARQPLELMSGSVVLPRLAWLRVRFPDGLEYGELFFRNGRQDEEWRRLQRVWKHGVQAFGGPGGS